MGFQLIIGGAYQGKLEYAKERFSLGENDIFTCTETALPDFSKRCLYGLQEFTLYCIKNNLDAVAYLKQHLAEIQNSVLICEDISCGVVPISAEMRAWREATGRLCIYLSKQAETVTRVFCGLPQVLK